MQPDHHQDKITKLYTKNSSKSNDYFLSYVDPKQHGMDQKTSWSASTPESSEPPEVIKRWNNYVKTITVWIRPKSPPNSDHLNFEKILKLYAKFKLNYSAEVNLTRWHSRKRKKRLNHGTAGLNRPWEKIENKTIKIKLKKGVAGRVIQSKRAR